MKKISAGKRLFLSVLAIFLLFAVAFIAFQQQRERQYKTGILTQRLQTYNADLVGTMRMMGKWDEATLSSYVRDHAIKGLRVTLVGEDGKVIFDTEEKDYAKFENHANNPEIMGARNSQEGSSAVRKSAALDCDYYYSATYFPTEGLFVRSALPYNNDLMQYLRADIHYVWFAMVVFLLLAIVLYRFVARLDAHIIKLRLFAFRADRNESLEIEDLADFPDDELGEIAERIVKIYKKLQNTRREQDMLKRQLTQNIAHELKTPVSSIQGYLETILDNPHINEATKQQFLQRCYAQSERLTALLRDISTLNRMDDAPDIMDFEAVDVSELVCNIRKEVALEMEKRDMTFTCEMPERLVVKGNRSLLYSIFRNLTDNSIAYAGDGTAITLEAKEIHNKWHFTFCDNGVGIPAQHLPRIFERFYRVDKGRSRQMGGTGLGLAIVKNAVLLHGGTIRVSSNLESSGVRFMFTLRK